MTNESPSSSASASFCSSLGNGCHQQQANPPPPPPPPLPEKPVPKPRRRLTIASGNSSGGEDKSKDPGMRTAAATEQLNGITHQKEMSGGQQKNINPSMTTVAQPRKAMAYRNGTAAPPLMAPQLPRKMLKCNPQGSKEDSAMTRSEITFSNSREKTPKEENKREQLVQQGQQQQIRRSATTIALKNPPPMNGKRQAVVGINNTNKQPTRPLQQQNGGAIGTSTGKRLRIPAPLNRLQLVGAQRQQQEGTKQQVDFCTKELSPIPYLTPFCPTASPEATGSSLNSPSPPAAGATEAEANPPPIFARSWPNGVRERQQPPPPTAATEDRLIEELANEGSPECRLIASWLGAKGRGNGNGTEAERRRMNRQGIIANDEEEEEEEEEERPRFSLDRLVPPELQVLAQSPPPSPPSLEQSISANFTLKRPSPRGQCQGTVFVHLREERGQFDCSMDSSGEQAQLDGMIQPTRDAPPPPPKVNLSNSTNYSSSPPRRSGVTLLEQLVKSHPIWFLPHLDRQAVVHLLRNQPPGVFIVRGSSRAAATITNASSNLKNLSAHRQQLSSSSGPPSPPPSTPIMMALSVRLPPTAGPVDSSSANDTAAVAENNNDNLDHFLLEAVGPSQSVRLEGSPNTFGSLPLLLNHYSQPGALQELKCQLRLPESIGRCESIQALQGLALMGQDFWTSPLAFAASSSSSSSYSSPASCSSSSNKSASAANSQQVQFCQSPTPSSLRSGPLPPFPVPPPPPPPMSTFIHRSHPHPHFAPQSHHNPYPHLRQQQQQHPSSLPYCQSPCPSIASTTATTTTIGTGVGMGGTSNGDEFALYSSREQHPQIIAAAGCCCCCYSGCPATHQAQQHQFPPLRKSHSVQSSLPPGHYGQESAAAAASTPLPWCSSPGSQSLREGRRWPPKQQQQQQQQKDGNFLRALFSPSPSRRKPMRSPDWANHAGESAVAVPLWEEPMMENGEGTEWDEYWNGKKLTQLGRGEAKQQPQQQQNGGQSIFSKLKGNFRRTSSSGLAKDDFQSGTNSSSELMWARQAAFRRTNTDMSGRGMAAALGRFRNAIQQQQQQQQSATTTKKTMLPPNSALPPQLARVLPQPRGLPNGQHRTMNGGGGGSNSATFLSSIAPAPADIRRNSSNQRSCWARPPTIIGQSHPHHFQQQSPAVGLRRIGQQQQVQLRTESTANRVSSGGGGGGQNRTQGNIATVRPQPKMSVPLPKTAENSPKLLEKANGHRPSEYTHLFELRPAEEGSGGWNGGRCSIGSKNGGDEVSVAGTDFNEPWDSNAWENLLDLAKFGDAKATEVPPLNGHIRRRSCSSSSNGSTWRGQSSQSSSTEEEDLDKEGVERNGCKQSDDDDISDNVAQEAVAMAVVLAGNGTLPNRKKPRVEEETEQENDPPSLSNLEDQNASMNTLILIEQAAKAANSSRSNYGRSQQARWTRESSYSLIDISKPIENGIRLAANAPDRPKIQEHIQLPETSSTNNYDPFAGSMNELNHQHHHHSPKKGLDNRPPSLDDGNSHRRSERRIQAMMERSIEEHNRQEEQQRLQKKQQLSPTNKAARENGKVNAENQLLLNNGRERNDFAQFNSIPSHLHYQHQQHNAMQQTSSSQFPFPSSVPICTASMDELSHHSRSGSICPSITPVLSPSRLRNTSQEHPGEEDPAQVIQRYVENLSGDDHTIFGATLQRFIECTLLSREQDPYVVVRRVRQFLNGMKNYLEKNGEGDLHNLISRQSERLRADEFLNIDGILEAVLNKILLVRIKAQLYRLMILECTRNGELGKISDNLTRIRAMSTAELGFPEGTQMPDTSRMEQISKQLRKMQNHYSPLKKLQLMLRALALAVPHLPLLSSSELRHQQAQQSNSSVLVYQSFDPRLRIQSGSSGSGMNMTAALKHPPADELIRWLVYLLARSSTINCEIEAWYIWELLPQQVLSTGDAAYFLSVIFSAVHVLKHPESIRRLKNVSLPSSSHHLPNIADFLGSQSTLHDQDESASSDLLLRVAIPNEQEGSIEYQTFPVMPKMNVARLCRVIAHQYSVSNPEDYALYLLLFEDNGCPLETPLEPREFPHLVRDAQCGRPHLFAYKRFEAKIAWPRRTANFSTLTSSPLSIHDNSHQQLPIFTGDIGGILGKAASR